VILNKRSIDYLMSCETVGEVRAFLRGVQILEESEAEEESKPAASAVTPAVPSPKYKLRNRGLQAKLLRILYTGPLSQSEIEDELDVDSTALDTCLKRMESSGLIESKKVEGRKFPQWTLTKAALPKAEFFVNNPKLKIKYENRA